MVPEGELLPDEVAAVAERIDSLDDDEFFTTDEAAEKLGIELHG